MNSQQLSSFEKSYLSLEEGKNRKKAPQPPVVNIDDKKKKETNTNTTNQNRKPKDGSLFLKSYNTKSVVNVQAIKRASIVELQKVLKTAKTYEGTVDGLYGDGTRRAISLYRQQDARSVFHWRML